MVPYYNYHSDDNQVDVEDWLIFAPELWICPEEGSQCHLFRVQARHHVAKN